MTVQFSATALQDGTLVPAAAGEGLARAAVSAMVERAATFVAPLWPLDRFVAVNPFLGLADRTFADASVMLGRIGRAQTLMPIAFYAGLIEAGRITDADLAAALASLRGTPGLPSSPEAVRALLPGGQDVPAPAGVLTLSEAADAVQEFWLHLSRSDTSGVETLG